MLLRFFLLSRASFLQSVTDFEWFVDDEAAFVEESMLDVGAAFKMSLT